ncbi:hypothetical protein EI94DRAFT_1814241 [Lactarius quietus]|nr:hypothetical protein EI94DRAFT_1814241 [Lactarius quietus]
MSTEDFDLNENVDDSEMLDDSFLDIQPIIPLSTSQIDNVELQKVLKCYVRAALVLKHEG